MDRLGEPPLEPVLTPRSIISLVLVVLGIALIVYYYLVVRVDPTVLPPEKAGGPAFLGDLAGWNYVIGFGAFFLGLMISAHPSTPLGRGRGVVVGMLGCFLIGLLWICTYYVISDDITRVPIFNDLPDTASSSGSPSWQSASPSRLAGNEPQPTPTRRYCSSVTTGRGEI